MADHIAKTRMAVPEPLLALAEFGEFAPQAWKLQIDGESYSAFLTHDHLSYCDRRWHISVSGENDVPPWTVMAAVGHELRPGVPFVLGVPPKSWWINIAENCLHLWELKDQGLLDQWRFERRGDTPS